MTETTSPHSVDDDKGQIADRDHLMVVNAILQILLDSQKHGANRVRIEPGDSSGQATSVGFYSVKDSTNISEITRTESHCQDTAILNDCLNSRSFFWPDVDDSLFASNHSRQPRILIAPHSDFRLLADFNSQRKPGSNQFSISLDNIQRSGITPLLDRLQLSEIHRQFVSSALTKRQGLILANELPAHNISAAAILMALRPDAVYFPRCETAKDWQDALTLSSKNLVLVSLLCPEPVDLIFQAIGAFANSPGLKKLCQEQLVLSFAHSRVKHSCSACLKSTQVTPDTLARVPESLRGSVPDSYMFSRGCKSCGNSAYHGTIGLDSVILIDDQIRSLLNQGSPAEAIASHAYGNGTRTVVEDGLSKITAGLSSFEEVLKLAPNIAPSFLQAIVDHKTKQQLKPLGQSQTKNNGGMQSNRSNLLIIEDDSDQRDVLELVFKTEGFNVIAAENGKEALALLESKEVDVVVCDVMMPVMNGMEFIKELRKGTHKNLPVLMLTAVGDSNDEYQLLSFGADDYCQKNVKRKILVKRVERLLERKKQGNPLEHLLASE